MFDLPLMIQQVLLPMMLMTPADHHIKIKSHCLKNKIQSKKTF